MLENQYLEQIKEDTNRYRRLAEGQHSFEAKIEAIRRDIFNGYLKVYKRNQAKFTEALAGHGGNCEAQTKLLIYALESAKIPFPVNRVLGVQQFQDHVQPVIYNLESGEVWDLTSGRIHHDINAPIYHPPILFYAYLKGQGVDPVVNVDELLIMDASGTPKMRLVKPSCQTNSDLKFEGGKGRFTEEEIPEEQEMGFQESRNVHSFISKEITQKNWLTTIKNWVKKILP